MPIGSQSLHPLTEIDVANGPGGSGSQNSTIPANQTLAWESVFSFGSPGDDTVLDVEYSGNYIYIYGKNAGDFTIGPQSSLSLIHI